MTTQETGPKFARPVHEVRIGLVWGAVWANRGENGTRYHVTFDRRYRHGEEWKTAVSFGRDDLLTLSKVANEAHSWITQQSIGKRAKAGAPEDALPERGPAAPAKFWNASRSPSRARRVSEPEDSGVTRQEVGSRANA